MDHTKRPRGGHCSNLEQNQRGSQPPTQKAQTPVRDCKKAHPAETFLRLLGKDPSRTWFRTITKGKGANLERSGRDLQGFDPIALEKANRAGGGVYFVSGNADQATSENKKTRKPTGCVEDKDVIGCPAFYIEWDDKPIEWQKTAWKELRLPEPTVMVVTGGKSVHCYWALQEPMEPAAWKKLQARLIDFAGGDKQCKNPSRLMRLPGFAYIDKETGKPTEKYAEVIHQENVSYTVTEIEQCLQKPDKQHEIKNALVEIPLTTEFPPRSVAEIEAAANCIPKRIGGEGTYEQDRNALCGCSAALKEAGVTDHDREALRLLGHKWPSQAKAEQVLQSTTTRNAASFWKIAKEHGFNLKRKSLKKPTNPKPPKVNPEKYASLQSLMQRIQDGWDDKGRAQTLSAGSLAEILPVDYFLFNELDLRAYFKTTSGWVRITDADLDSSYVILTGKGWSIGTDPVVKAVMHVARQNSVHPVQSYLRRIKADQSIKPYDLDLVGPRLFRSPNPLHAAMIRKWLIGAVARAMRPGCQMDYCLVLKGAQGLLKSTSLKTLAGEEWFTSSHAEQEKDFLLNIQSCWIYELAELEAITRKKQAGALKNLISTATDTFRPPYGRTAERMPRQSVFCATVNKDQFLRDDTGNRRYWVVPIEGTEKLDREAILAARDSIWKAAVIAHEKGETPMLEETHEALSAEQNKDFNEQDAWVEMVQAWIDGDPLLKWDPERDPSPRPFEPGAPITSAEILYSAGLKRPDAITRSDEMRVSEVLQSMGFKKTRMRSGQERIRGWVF